MTARSPPPVGGDEIDRSFEGFPCAVEVALGEPAPADHEEQSGACSWFVAGDELESVLSGAGGVGHVTLGNQASRFEQRDLGSYERSIGVDGEVGDRLEGFDEVMHVIPTAGVVGDPGGGEGQARVAPQDLSRKQLSPFANVSPALPDEDPTLPVDGFCAAVGLPGGDVVPDRVARHLMVDQPVGRQSVTGAAFVGRSKAQPFGDKWWSGTIVAGGRGG